MGKGTEGQRTKRCPLAPITHASGRAEALGKPILGETGLVWIRAIGFQGLKPCSVPQVVEETQAILREYGFRFVRRGPIFVKGKGELLTFFLKGRDKPAAYPNGSSVTLPHQVVDNP